MHETRMGHMLIIEDDVEFARMLARSFGRRGYQVRTIREHAELAQLPTEEPVDVAVVDLNLGGVSGLRCVETLHERNVSTRIVVLTGYASIATAVEAIKLGATHYLPKPASTDEIEDALGFLRGRSELAVPPTRTSIKRLEWDRIQQTLAETDFNVSETARRLGMHRRTLARKLQKRPPP